MSFFLSFWHLIKSEEREGEVIHPTAGSQEQNMQPLRQDSGSFSVGERNWKDR